MTYSCISIDDAQVLIDSGEVTLADIRDGGAYAEGSMPGAVHLSDANVEDFLQSTDKTKPLVVYCYHGHSSRGAAEFFAGKGFTTVYSVDGGYEAWRQRDAG